MQSCVMQNYLLSPVIWLSVLQKVQALRTLSLMINQMHESGAAVLLLV